MAGLVLSKRIAHYDLKSASGSRIFICSTEAKPELGYQVFLIVILCFFKAGEQVNHISQITLRNKEMEAIFMNLTSET